jgi:predicted nucleotidyltransferase
MLKKTFLLIVIAILFLASLNYSQAENNPLYLGSNNVYYTCQGNPITPQNDDNSENNNMTFDLESVKILNDTFFTDKNGVYFVSTFNYYCYFFEVPNADSETFKIFTEDKNYAMDKNNIYYWGKAIGENETSITDDGLYSNLKGKIILKVESNGEAYYVSPNKKKMYFLSRPIIAFKVMREQGVGITNKNLEKIPVADSYCPTYKPNCENNSAHNIDFANTQRGKIFLQVEENGEAWYVNPENGKRYFLGRPTDAFNVMRNLGLGISNMNFEKMINNNQKNSKVNAITNISKKGMLLIYDPKATVSELHNLGFDPLTWYLIEEGRVWKDAIKSADSNLKLSFSDDSICFYSTIPKKEDSCFSGNIRWGYGSNVIISGSIDGDAISVITMEITD